LAGINGGIQSQLDGKLSSNLGISNANKVLLSDASGNITAISAELGKFLTSDENGHPIWDTIDTATQSFVAQANSGVSAGDIVQYVNGNIVKGVGGVSSELDIQSPSTFFDYTTNVISATSLNNTTFVIAFQDSSNLNKGTAVIGTLSGSSVSYGSPYTWCTQTAGISIDTIDAERFVIIYRSDDGSNMGNAIIGKVSGTAISFGESYTFHESCSDEFDVSTVNEKRFVVAYQDTGNGNIGMAKVGTVFDTKVSFGLAYTINDAATTSISTSSVGGYTFVVAYEDGVDSMGKAVCGALTDNDESEFVEFQGIPTMGALDWEAFVINGEHYVAIANYYDGTSNELSSSIYKWNGNSFTVFQTFSTNGVSAWKFFDINNEYYLMQGNGKNDTTQNIDSYIYKWDGNSFIKIQSISTSRAKDVEFFELEENYYIVISNKHDDSTYNVNFKIYKWNSASFSEFQTISANGASDCEHFTIDGQTYLGLANYNNDSGYILNSYIYKWDGDNFAQFQTISTKGSLGFEHFIIENEHYLAIANYYDGSSYSLDSLIYKWNGSSFTQHQTINTSAVYNFNYFEMNRNFYLTVSNEKNETTYNIYSKVLKWNETTFEDYQLIKTNGATDSEFIQIDSEYFLLYSNFKNDTTNLVDSKIYRWNGSKNAITFGNEQTFNTSPTTNISNASFNDNRIYIAYQDQGDANKGKVISGSISQTEIVFTNSYTFNTTQTTNIAMSSINETSLFIAYADGDNGSIGKALIAKPSNGAIAIGAAYTFNSAATDLISIQTPGTSKAFITFQGTDQSKLGKGVVVNLEKIYPIGIALNNAPLGQDVQIAHSGIVNNLTGLIPGNKYYADEFGSLVTNATQRFIGIALSEEELLIQTDSPGAINTDTVVISNAQTSVSSSSLTLSQSIWDLSSNLTDIQTTVESHDISITNLEATLVNHQSQLDEKLSSNLGVSNANKVLLSDASGNITAITGETGKVLTTDENGHAIWDNINTATQTFLVESGSGVSAGDIVQYVNGNIIKGVGGVSSELNIQSASTFSEYTCNYIAATSLDNNTFVIAYQDNNDLNKGTAVIGEVSGGTVTYGRSYTWSNQTAAISIDALESDRFVIVYRSDDGSNIGSAIIGNVSGTVISFGNPYTFHQACSDKIDVSTVTPKRFVVAYQDTSNSNFGMAKVGTSFGTHISFGLAYTVNDAATSFISTSSVGEYTFVVAYKDGLDSMGKAVCGALTDNDNSEFVEFQAIPTFKAVAWETFRMNGEFYIAVANRYIEGIDDEFTSSIYKWNGNAFSVYQTISTYGANDWKFFIIKDEYYQILSNYRTNSSHNIDSYIYKWDGNSFVRIQSIATCGAFRCEFIELDNQY